MLIVHLITELASGGAETQLQHLVLASAGSRFRHAVIVLGEGGAISDELKVAGVEVHILRMRRGQRILSGIGQLVRHIRRLKPDVLHCWLYHACLLGVFAGLMARKTRVIWGLRAAHDELGVFSPLTRIIVRLCAFLSACPRVIVVNSNAGRMVHEGLGYKTSRMRVVPNGVDTELFAPRPEDRQSVRVELDLPPDVVMVGMIARYDPMKDHAMFLRAAGLVLREHASARFVLAGTGVTKSNRQLAQLVQDNGLQDVVHLLGPRRDIPRLASALDIACLSSWSESFPNVVLEAMASAVPCVVTNVGDTASVVGAEGRVVPPRDSAAFAEAVCGLIAAGSKARALAGRLARMRVLSQFTIQRTVDSYESIYDEVIS